ncbi:MarP family serine protease [Nocardioides yefusunii]|uniref:MarP family serine protease n=1 Tax=Nocardioides yefusunii TaxID=2500546 RepID=A0ABW1R1B9_9ACTN|nr:MarP family serine protease [Nocardioides yefusunii]
MNVLDWVLVVVVALYALSGYWQGFITGAFATAGLLFGGLAGVWAAPQVLGDATPSIWVSLGALLIVIGCASAGQAMLQWLGAKLRSRITWQPVRAVDAVGGAALSAVAVLLVAWILGVAISGSKIGAITPAVRSSTILSAVDDALPGGADRALRQFNSVVGTSFFPRYMEPFAPERIVEVPQGDPQVLNDPDVVAAQGSVLKIYGYGCGKGIEGTGFVYANDRIMTNAHVVAGIDQPEVQIDGENRPAKVVHYDPDLDVAVLAVDVPRAPLAFSRDVESKQKVAVLGYPQDGPYDVQSGRVRSRQPLRSPDINGQGTVIRDVLAVRALVRPGNSGGPVVDVDGRVVGVVFAASVSDDETGYALTAEQVEEAALLGRRTATAVDTGSCIH